MLGPSIGNSARRAGHAARFEPGASPPEPPRGTPWYALAMARPEKNDESGMNEKAREADDDALPCPVYDDLTGRPCGKPMEPDTLTCKDHDTRSSSTQISRLDAARRRYGV